MTWGETITTTLEELSALRRVVREVEQLRANVAPWNSWQLWPACTWEDIILLDLEVELCRKTKFIK